MRLLGVLQEFYGQFCPFVYVSAIHLQSIEILQKGLGSSYAKDTPIRLDQRVTFSRR